MNGKGSIGATPSASRDGEGRGSVDGCVLTEAPTLEVEGRLLDMSVSAKSLIVEVSHDRPSFDFDKWPNRGEWVSVSVGPPIPSVNIPVSEFAPNETHDTMAIIRAFTDAYYDRGGAVGAITHFVPDFLKRLRERGLVVAEIETSDVAGDPRPPASEAQPHNPILSDTQENQ